MGVWLHGLETSRSGSTAGADASSRGADGCECEGCEGYGW